MKIIHFCDSISIGGGIASFIQNLSNEQSLQNEVSLGVISHYSDEIRMDFDRNIKIVDFNKSRPGFSLIHPIKIFVYLLKSDYDVVHIHSSFLYYFLSVLLLHRKYRFIYTVHSDAVKENSSKWDKRFWKLKRYSFRKKWILPVTISPNSKESFDRLYGMSSYMVINGIKNNVIYSEFDELKQYRYTERTKLLLHVGRITEAKNQVVLCQAVSQLIAEGYDLSLVIVGVNQDQRIFDKISPFFSDRIIYLGERVNIRKLMADSDAMCLSSIWEGMPITLLEALSVGCIPICTPVGGISNIVRNGYNGILAASTGLQDYKLALNSYLNLNRKELNDIKEHAIESFKPYDISITAEKYMSLYTSNK